MRGDEVHVNDAKRTAETVTVGPWDHWPTMQVVDGKMQLNRSVKAVDSQEWYYTWKNAWLPAPAEFLYQFSLDLVLFLFQRVDFEWINLRFLYLVNCDVHDGSIR